MKPQIGFALVSAIFVLVVLAVLAGAAVRISSVQHTGLALDVQGAQAYQAARTGIEWGLYRQKRDGQCAATTSFTAPAASLSAFTITVNCAVDSGVYLVTATACNRPSGGNCPNTAAPGNGYVERKLVVSF